MKYALYSGFFAANSIIKSNIGLYRKNFLNKFKKELDTLANIRRIYNSLTDDSYSKGLRILKKLNIKSKKDLSRIFMLAQKTNSLIKFLRHFG